MSDETTITFDMSAPVRVRAICRLDEEGQAEILQVLDVSAPPLVPGECIQMMDAHDLQDLDKKVRAAMESDE